jgi:soluble lytic murein transglycosylase-like protein
VPPALALAVIEEESNFNQDAVGQFGEIGAAQIMPRTADAYDIDRGQIRASFEANVRGGLKIMRSLLEQFPEPLAIAAYNGGTDFEDSVPRVRTKLAQYVADVQRRKEKYESIQCE